MSGKVASEKVAYYAEINANSTNDPSIVTFNYSTTEINTTLALCVGIWQVFTKYKRKLCFNANYS